MHMKGHAPNMANRGVVYYIHEPAPAADVQHCYGYIIMYTTYDMFINISTMIRCLWKYTIYAYMMYKY